MACGRPLWGCFEDDFQTAFELAKQKLKSEESLQHLTCFVLRTGAEVLPQDELAHKLVLSGLATLLYIDVEGSRCLIKYTAEPILSNAARIEMCSIEFLSTAIKHYIDRLDQGAFHEGGVAGELIGRLVVLRAFDSCLIYSKNCVESQSQAGTQATAAAQAQSPAKEVQSAIQLFTNNLFSPKIGVVKLKNFLKSLTRVQDHDFWKFDVSDSVLNGLVSVNQFVQLDNLHIDQVMLADAFVRGIFAALHCPCC